MKEIAYIEAGNLVFSVNTKKERERDGFLTDTILTFQLSGQLKLENSSEKITIGAGDIVLIRKNQIVKVSKSPFEGCDYRAVILQFKEEALREIALKQQIEVDNKYHGNPNVFIPRNDFLKGFLNSILPYGVNPKTTISATLGQLKLEEAIELLLQNRPELKEFLFDFSEPYKIDLEKFMSANYKFNIPVEKFAQLTGRSLAGFKRDFQKTFHNSPRKWLREKRLEEAYYQIEKNNKKPSEIFLDLGFESLSHFSNSFKEKFGVRPSSGLKHQ